MEAEKIEPKIVIAIIYILGILGLSAAVVLWVKHRREIDEIDVDKKISSISSLFQLAIVCVGVVVAVETLDSSNEALDFQRQMRTNELLREIDTEELNTQSLLIHNFLEAAFLPKSFQHMTEVERTDFVVKQYESGLLSNLAFSFQEKLEKMKVCADTTECSSERIYGVMCFAADDFVRYSVHPLRLKLPSGPSNLAYLTRDRMSDWNRQSCSFIHHTLDYLDERYGG